MVKEKIESDINIHQEIKGIRKSDAEKQDCSASDSFHSEYGVQTEVVIVRYGELALKSSGIRNWYEKILMKNIAAMLDSRGISYSLMRREWGRIFVET